MKALFERNSFRNNWNVYPRGVFHLGCRTESDETTYKNHWARKVNWVSTEVVNEKTDWEEDKDYQYNVVCFRNVELNTAYAKRLSSLLDTVEFFVVISDKLDSADYETLSSYLKSKNYRKLCENTEDEEGVVLLFARRVTPEYKVNLFDKIFAHSRSCSGNYPTHFEWVRDEMAWDGVTLFTDVHMLTNPTLVQKVESKLKIGWLLESKAVIRYDPNYIWRMRSMYDYIFTHDKQLIDADPDKFLFVTPGSQRCIHPKDCQVYNKEKLVSIAVSLKKDTDGHSMRHAIVSQLNDKITDVWGHAYNEFGPRLVPYKDYMFIIVVENHKYDHYWSEKLLEPFWTGTVPIYRGCPSFPDWFDPNGVITFDTIEELSNILDSLNAELYYSKMDSIQENYKRSLKYLGGAEDFMFETYPNIFSKENTPQCK